MNFLEFISILIGIISIEYSAGQLWTPEKLLLKNRKSLLWMFWMSIILIIASIVENSLV